MWSRTASVLTVCRSQYRFHFYCIVFVGVLVLAGFSSPARSQEESTSGYSGFESESPSEWQSSMEGSLSELTDGGRFELLGSMGGKIGPLAMYDGYAYVGFGRNLTVLDISNPAHMELIKHIPRPRTISAITTTDKFVIVSDEGGDVCVYSLVDPTTPILLNQEHPLSINGNGSLTSLFVHENYLYAFWGDSLFIIDLSDPSVPKLTGSCYVSEVSSHIRIVEQDLQVDGDYAYLVSRDHGGLVVIDLRQKTNPVVVVTEDSGSDTPLYSLLVEGEVLYALGEDAGHFRLYCIDISVPLLPKVLGSILLNSSVNGCRSFSRKGSKIYITGTYFEVIDISDPTTPLKYEIDRTNLYLSQQTRSIFHGDTLFISYRMPGELLAIDWSQINHPLNIGSYSEPYGVRNLALNGNTLFMGGSGGWIVDISQPSHPSILYGNYYYVALNPLDEHLMVASNAIANVPETAVYDISDPFQPSFLSYFKIILSGNVIYEDPLLFGVSRTSGLSVIRPRYSTVYFQATSEFESHWGSGIVKTGNWILAHMNWPKQGLVLYDATQPTQPVIAGFTHTGLDCFEMKTAGQSLFLSGTQTSVLAGYDISDPINPRRISQIPVDTNPTAFELSSGLAYVATESPLFQVFDLTLPEKPHQLLTSGERPGAGTVDDILASGSLLYVAESGGLSIYRHILPATPTEVTFTCAGLVHQDTRELHFKIYAGEPPEGGCSTSSVIDATPLVDCRLGCPFFTSEGMVACDETPFDASPMVDCNQAISEWLDSVIAAINDQAGDMLRVTRTSPNSFSLESIQPFYGTLCGEEIGVSCDNAGNRLLNDCPIHNLMDGVDGNESQAESGGFGIVWKKHVEPEEPSATVTPSPTAIPSDTPLVTPSFTETATGTPPPTLTEIPTPTVTQTMEGDVIPDGEINAKDLLEVLRQMEDAAETGRSGLLFDFSRVWKP